MYLGSWKIDDYLTFPANTHRADTGEATDGDGVPTYRIFEDETGIPILTGSMAKLDDANTTGFYTERIQLTAANDFEIGKSYTIYVEVTVNSVVGTMAHTFQMKAEVSLDGNTNQSGDGYAIVNNATYGNAKLVRSTTPANTLDVSATGEAGVDVIKISGDATAADDLELLVENSKGADNKVLLSSSAQTSVVIPTVTTVTDGAKSAELAKVPKSDSNVVWNATAQTTIQTKAAAALTAYAGPTKTEMDSAHALLATLAEQAKVPKSDSTVTWNATARGSINAEVDTALNTAIPGAPTANSINERVKTIDDKLPAGSIGDATEAKEDTIIAKTDNIPASPATVAKQDDLKTQIGTAGAGLTNVGMLSQADSELAGIPTTASSLGDKIRFVFQFLRNKFTDGAGTATMFKEDASTQLGTQTVSDDGTTFTRGEWS